MKLKYGIGQKVPVYGTEVITAASVSKKGVKKYSTKSGAVYTEEALIKIDADINRKRIAEKTQPQQEDKPTPKYKVGDKAKVVGNTTGHRFKEGAIIEIVVDCLGHGYRAKDTDERGGCWHHCYVVDSDLEPYTEPEYYNGEVVCVEKSESEHSGFTIGKVYKFKNGTVVDDDGYVRPIHAPIISLDDEYAREWANKFIPYKGKANADK